MKKWKIALIELGMLFCIILAATLLPEQTSLKAFLAMSSEFFLVGNYLLVKVIEDGKAKENATKEFKKKFKWARILGIFAFINLPWVVSQFIK
jgi:hypothetical protein